MKKQIKKSGGKALGLKDDRFSHIASDPKFSGLKNLDKKVVIEKRFAAALTEERFSNRARVDKRGRVLKKAAGNDMTDLYVLEGEDDEDKKRENTKKEKKKDKRTKPVLKTSEEDESDIEESEDDDDEEEIIKLDLARGEGNLLTSSDDDSDSDWELDGNLQQDLDLAEIDKDVERVEWASSRIAVCNLDWDLVRCEDILILVNSFTPKNGCVKRITIYLSDFGKEKLAIEEKHGPKLDLNKPLEDYDDIKEDDETRIAVRKYQIDRLKYYYAVIECDCESTASAIYDECDGSQFESTGLKMDMRFIPDDMQFEEDRIIESLCPDDLNIEKYQSKEKLKSNVSTTTSKLGWDETSADRRRKIKEAFLNPEMTDLIADSDSDGEGKANRNAILSLLQTEDKQFGMKVDWEERDDDNENEESDEEESMTKRRKSLVENEEITKEEDQTEMEPKKNKKNSFKGFLEKRKEKRKERKQSMKDRREAERESLDAVTAEAKKKKKAEKDSQKAAMKAENTLDTAEKVVTDERFKALFTDSAFAIEQSSKQYKGSKLIEKQATEKAKLKQKVNVEAKEDIVAKLMKKSAKWKN